MAQSNAITDLTGSVTQHNGMPTFGNMLNGWTSPIVAAGSDDLAGQLLVTSGILPIGGVDIGRLTFKSQFVRAPRAVLVEAQLGGFATAVTESYFTIWIANTPGISTQYVIYYYVVP